MLRLAPVQLLGLPCSLRVVPSARNCNGSSQFPLTFTPPAAFTLSGVQHQATGGNGSSSTELQPRPQVRRRALQVGSSGRWDLQRSCGFQLSVGADWVGFVHALLMLCIPVMPWPVIAYKLPPCAAGAAPDNSWVTCVGQRRMDGCKELPQCQAV
jgi:hypothetical protein